MIQEFDIEEVGTASMVLFAVIDIIGSVPIIIKLKQKVGEIEAGKASVVAMFIMVIFLFLGEGILKALGVDIKAFAVAGSFVIFFIAIELVLGVNIFQDEDPKVKNTAAIVPLAFPIIAGAGTMTTIIALKAEYASINIIVAILLNTLLIYVTIRLSKKIEHVLGPGGIAVMKKVFGIILLSIAIKLFTKNASHLFFDEFLPLLKQ